MSTLLNLYPGDGFVLWVIQVLIGATLVVAAALLLDVLLGKRQAAARYSVWLGALVLVLSMPVWAWIGQRTDMGFISIPQFTGDAR